MPGPRTFMVLIALCITACAHVGTVGTSDPLPSWNEGQTKTAIRAFVDGVTDPGSNDFVPPEERIAAFDNDGTLWSEQPLYFQFTFALERVKAEAANHPEWRTTQPYKAVLEGDMKTFLASGEHGLIEVLLATHAGMSVDRFHEIAAGWLSSARHPRFGRRYVELVYQPMLELLAYLRGNEFKTYIVSGGTVEFIRVFAERVYGVPPEQVIGTTIETRFEIGENGKPVLMREPKIEFVDDGPGKPVGIQRGIGRRPIFAFGNSDGDLQMLQWTAAGGGPRFAGIVWHTDATREWAYDRNAHVGKLDRALDEARAEGWVLADIAKDWKQVYPVAATPISRPNEAGRIAPKADSSSVAR